jgi:hypothetical protein
MRFGILIATVALLTDTEAFSRMQSEAIEIGITRPKVERILGIPGDYRTRAAFYHMETGSRYVVAEYWRGNHALILVWFDKNDRVESKEYRAKISYQTDNAGKILR